MAAVDEDCEEGEDVVVHQMKLSQLLVHSDNEILESFDRLQHNYHSMPKGQFTTWQKACGLTFDKCALLLDMDLRRAGILHPALPCLSRNCPKSSLCALLKFETKWLECDS